MTLSPNETSPARLLAACHSHDCHHSGLAAGHTTCSLAPPLRCIATSDLDLPLVAHRVAVMGLRLRSKRPPRRAYSRDRAELEEEVVLGSWWSLFTRTSMRTSCDG